MRVTILIGGGIGKGWVHVGLTNGKQTIREYHATDHKGFNMTEKPAILTEAIISQWLREHRANYATATETIKACMVHFRLHRRHRRMLWAIYTRTDFNYLKGS